MTIPAEVCKLISSRMQPLFDLMYMMIGTQAKENKDLLIYNLELLIRYRDKEVFYKITESLRNYDPALDNAVKELHAICSDKLSGNIKRFGLKKITPIPELNSQPYKELAKELRLFIRSEVEARLRALDPTYE